MPTQIMFIHTFHKKFFHVQKIYKIIYIYIYKMQKIKIKNQIEQRKNQNIFICILQNVILPM